VLTIEIRVNGSIVSIMEAHNSGEEMSAPGLCCYKYRGTRWPIANAGQVETFEGEVLHLRSDGVEALAQKLYRALADKREQA